MTQPLPRRVEVIVPATESAGTYSNAFAAWFNQTDFTIDFLVHLPSEPRQDESSGEQYMHVPVQVVSRVKIPASMIFRLIEQLNATMTQYETQNGEITHLGPPIPPPADNAGPSGDTEL